MAVPSRSRRGSQGGPTGDPADDGPAWATGAAAPAIAARLARWSREGASRRVWARDPSFWPQAPPASVAGGLGWLRAPEEGAAMIDALEAFAEEVERDGFEHVVLCAMGGSSLAAEVIGELMPHRAGRPKLTVLSSTHPEAVRDCLHRAPPSRTLYLISSKSGTTLEPNVFFRFFWSRAATGGGAPGRQFVAVTDPGTELERLAGERGFRACFLAPPDVGGRYSALTVFGLLPSVLTGVDASGLLAAARTMATRCGEAVAATDHPGLRLGATLGELGRAGRDKLVFVTSKTLRPFPVWAEQLVAESLGKLGRGIVPVAAPEPADRLPTGPDVVLVHLTLAGEGERGTVRALGAAADAGVPVVRLELGAAEELGREFFRWEFGIAACGAVLEVDPFDQPDVEHAKELAREAMDPRHREAATAGADGLRLTSPADLDAGLGRWLGLVRPGDYVAVQAFLAPEPRTDGALERLAAVLGRRLPVVVTVGYGPRFQHSTGQLHKGGPPSGVFLQLVDEPAEDVEVPGLGLTFGAILRAQARGDRQALEEKGRRVLVVDLGADTARGLATLAERVDRAASRRTPGRTPS